MNIIEISDDEIVSIKSSEDSDDEPIVSKIVRLKRKRSSSPIELSDDESPGPSRPSTDREVSPGSIDLDKVRLPSPDDGDSDTDLFDEALEYRDDNPMVPGMYYFT